MKRQQETIDRLARIKIGAEVDGGTLLASAAVMDPGAVTLSNEVGEMVAAHIHQGGSPSATQYVLMGSLMYGLARNMKAETDGAGEALEHVVTAITSIIQFTAEQGFAEARREQQQNAQ